MTLLLLQEITVLKAKLDYYKTELHSQTEKLKEKSECFVSYIFFNVYATGKET